MLCCLDSMLSKQDLLNDCLVLHKINLCGSIIQKDLLHMEARPLWHNIGNSQQGSKLFLFFFLEAEVCVGGGGGSCSLYNIQLPNIDVRKVTHPLDIKQLNTMLPSEACFFSHRSSLGRIICTR